MQSDIRRIFKSLDKKKLLEVVRETYVLQGHGFQIGMGIQYVRKNIKAIYKKRIFIRQRYAGFF